jgi:hypothetical protein
VSETLFKFLFSEVTAIRITCQRKITKGEICGGTLEVPIKKLHEIGICPFCHNAFENQVSTPFGGLQGVIKHMVALEADSAHVEIIIPSNKAV